MFDSPVWNPALAAGAGAGFAGVLGAIVVAVTFQIVLVEPRKEGHAPGRLPSLALAPVTVVLTLAAAYLYVVLSGTESTVATTIDCISDMSRKYCHGATPTPIWVSASMFAIGGSYLALGAIGLAATLLLVVREHAIRATPMVQNGTLVFFTSVSLIAFAALIWGYRDADWVLRNERMSASHFFFAHGGWISLAVGLGIGTAFAVAHRKGRMSRMPALILLHLFLVLPIMWYLVVEGTQPGQMPIGSNAISQVMLGWVAIGFGFLAASIDREVWSELLTDQKQAQSKNMKDESKTSPSRLAQPDPTIAHD